jgi:hypothetical protein
MGIKTIEFCGRLLDESERSWFVFDGVEKIQIPKSQAKLRRVRGDDYEITIPEWLARDRGII